MALPILRFDITHVAKPNVGENHPAEVLAEVAYVLPNDTHGIRSEWESLRTHDVVFLLAIQYV